MSIYSACSSVKMVVELIRTNELHIDINSKELVVLHDYFETADGGGRLCMLLADALKSDLVFGFQSEDHPYLKAYKPAKCYDLSARSIFPIWKQLKLSHGFRKSTQFVRKYTNAIYSGTYSPLTILNHSAHNNIYYCHTPPRFVYDKRDFYIDGLPTSKQLILKLFIDYLKPQYEMAMARMDSIISNSFTVQERVRMYLGRETEVIHPPCETARFTWKGQQKYYLSNARLDSLKQVDECIKAFIRLPHQNLVVTSEGAEMNNLKRLANNAPNIHFTGVVEESQLLELLGNAIATIYIPIDEDFGMAPVESMAAGKPVIGVTAGGLLETITHNETGMLLPAAFTTDNLVLAVEKMTASHALSMRTACENRAKQFDSKLFVEKMYSLMSHK